MITHTCKGTQHTLFHSHTSTHIQVILLTSVTTNTHTHTYIYSHTHIHTHANINEEDKQTDRHTHTQFHSLSLSGTHNRPLTFVGIVYHISLLCLSLPTSHQRPVLLNLLRTYLIPFRNKLECLSLSISSTLPYKSRSLPLE